MTTLITAAKETTAILVYYSLLLELKAGFCSTIGVQPVKRGVRSLSLRKTGTNYENQSATVFIIPNHGSEVLNRRDQRGFFPSKWLGIL